MVKNTPEQKSIIRVRKETLQASSTIFKSVLEGISSCGSYAKEFVSLSVMV
jgi:hypothetical protein